MTNKVHCIHCNFFVENIWTTYPSKEGENCCDFGKKIIKTKYENYENEYIKTSVLRLFEPKTQNKNNNCKFYKPTLKQKIGNFLYKWFKVKDI